jgi:ATP-dependent DNA ligase
MPGVLEVLPQLVGNRGLAGLQLAIAEPGKWALEPKVDGVRGLLAFLSDGMMETRNRRGIRRDWLRGDGFEAGLRRLAQRLPILWDGTVLDGELIAGRFAGTMAALHGSRRRLTAHRLPPPRS